MEKISTVDYNFFYKTISRFILLHKLGGLIKNIYQIPYISKLVCFFSLDKVDNFEKVEIYNYMYLFKFFLGQRAYLTNYKSYLDAGQYSYSFKVILILNKKIYNYMYFFLNDIFWKIDKNYLKILKSEVNFFHFMLKDVNVFSETKDNLGLFNVYQPLNMYFYIGGLDLEKMVFKNLKIKKFIK